MYKIQTAIHMINLVQQLSGQPLNGACIKKLSFTSDLMSYAPLVYRMPLNRSGFPLIIFAVEKNDITLTDRVK